MHLICNATHTLLAASRSRKSEFGEQELIGRSLWPFATVEIATAEVEIRDAGLLVLELDTVTTVRSRCPSGPVAAGGPG
jgi:hypothetical protein